MSKIVLHFDINGTITDSNSTESSNKIEDINSYISKIYMAKLRIIPG